VQRPHPPILIGGLSDAALRRVVRQGNGWLAVTTGPAQLQKSLGTLKELASAAGRRFDDISLVYKLFLNIGEPKRNPDGVREPGTGSVAEIIDDVKRLFDLGFTTIIVRNRGTTSAELTTQIDRFVTEIVPKT
jgi:alkanesulfonate monooxygenase SsuD/methylene tetrahydromethanopterin reductase-like flavin-dependent oxidoreductase (luciferase family)